MDKLTQINNIEELENIFKEAYAENSNSVAVELTIPHRTETEIVFHRRQSIYNRLAYYKRTFSNDLRHNRVDGIQIVAVGHGDLSLFEVK